MRKNRSNAAPGAFSAFRVSEWSVRRKVVAVLAIPVVLAAVFGGLRVRTELQDASTYTTNQQRATVLGPAVAYLNATERLELPWTLSAQLDAADPTEQYFKAESDLKKAAAGANLNAEEQSLVTEMLQIGGTLSSGGGTGITATPSVAVSDLTTDASQLINSTLNTEGTPDPRVQALIQSLAGRVSLVKQQMLIKNAGNHPTLLDSVWLAAEIGVEGSAIDRLKEYVGGRRIGALKTNNGTRLGQATTAQASELVATPKMFQTYDALNARLLSGIDQKLAANASSSKARALTDAAIILVALVASLLLAMFVARALIVPLRRVRAGALEVATERLPETVARIRNGQEPEEFTPIPVHSHEELGQLARAVDDMHKQAVTLATGEAHLRSQVGAMFVTLSRRNTTLVNQQLALIESLEQDEEDPQRLEQLFSLDHLATRMRRTAESLVILGGAPGRTAGFEELSVSDVIHAAVSEVQDYQRVRIEAAPERMIVGRAASDVVHLMAELIDNALSYSPPGSPVSIQAAEDDGKIEIEVIDNGLGMAGDALAQTNDSLKSGGEVTIDTARRMGLFVVSRLAEEHGLKVKLRRNTNGGGIIATIFLPAGVLVTGPVEHVSVLDAPEAAEEPVAPVVEDEPDEEYDPYLERIEEAIAAVTGLPRRRPGQVPGPATEVPAAPVSMFEASPELPPGFEPTELPSMEEADVASEPLVAELDADTEDGHDEVAPEDEERLAQVVTPDFGAERHEVTAETDDETSADSESYEQYEALVDHVADVEESEALSEDLGVVVEESAESEEELSAELEAVEPEPETVEPEPVSAEAEPLVDETDETETVDETEARPTSSPRSSRPWAAQVQSWGAAAAATAAEPSVAAEAAPESRRAGVRRA